MSDDQSVRSQASGSTARKAYVSPELKEYGNMKELTQGTGLVVLDLLVQGELTVSVAATVV